METAEVLAIFFQSVFTQEEYGPLTKECYETKRFLSGVMEKLVISPDSVKKLLGNLNDTKSMGPDEIHPKLLKYLSNCDNFVIALTNLFNACISQECIPDIWKTAIVIPIHKKGSVHQPENYRPVSLTCVLCKMFETFLREHIIDYVSLVITEKQHGFLKGRSCLSNLLETIEKANEYMYEGNCVDILTFVKPLILCLTTDF